MQACRIEPSLISGMVAVPASKSHSMRAILLASMACGQSQIRNHLDSPDIWAMVSACQAFGAKINVHPSYLSITGVDAKPHPIEQVIDAGNSGQVLRFIGAIAGLIDGYTIITGDYSLRHQRPLQPLIAGLSQMGCFAVSSKQDGFAPLIVKGCMQGGEIFIDGQDSQPVSALIMASCFSSANTVIRVQNPGELPWLQLTLSWLDKLGLQYETDFPHHFSIPGQQRVQGFTYQVCGDFSSAAFLWVAAALSQREITLSGLELDDVQGDKKLLELLSTLGCRFESKQGKLKMTPPAQGFRGFDVDINAMIDALPILTVLACYANSPSTLVGAEIARMKESDRIATIRLELSKMGANIEEFADGLKIWPARLHGASLEAHADHRIALALTVASFAASSSSILHGIDSVAKSFPNFMAVFQSLGGKIAAL